jgi:hypothetical protein
MTQITFVRWCLDPQGRTPISVDPARVDCTEHYQDGMVHGGTGEAFPAATKLVMKGRQEYLVQGAHDEVVARLNTAGGGK